MEPGVSLWLGFLRSLFPQLQTQQITELRDIAACEDYFGIILLPPAKVLPRAPRAVCGETYRTTFLTQSGVLKDLLTLGIAGCNISVMTNTRKLLTMSEAAAKYCVSRQRMHVLCRTYNLSTEWIGPMRVIPMSELKKLPKNRPSGKTLRKQQHRC